MPNPFTRNETVFILEFRVDNENKALLDSPLLRCSFMSMSYILRPPPDRSKSCLLASKLECSGALHGGVRANAGAFARRSEGWRRGAGPWHRSSAYASSRRCWHGGQCHCLYGAPVAWAQVLQALQALRRSLVAHVEPQRLVGLAVVHDRLFVSVEGQRSQLVGDLLGETEGARRKGGAGGRGREVRGLMKWKEQAREMGKNRKKRENVKIRSKISFPTNMSHLEEKNFRKNLFSLVPPPTHIIEWSII